MQPNLLKAIILPILLSCSETQAPANSTATRTGNDTHNPFTTVAAIPLPEGYTRSMLEKGSFGEWLRNFPLKKDKTVYIFNGNRKANQAAQFAVLNISTGKKDLQQCADAIMRLRAEYLYEQKRFPEIIFRDNNNTSYALSPLPDRNSFDAYLEKVFSWCGTLSLEKQLKKVPTIESIAPGDVFIKGGSPGHAALVMDVAINTKGEKIFLLANGYMPAQDIHIVVNPTDNFISPWYRAANASSIETPEWTFTINQLRRW